MSISYCGECEQIVEGNTSVQDDVLVCKYCGAETIELSEDNPRKDQ